MLISETVSLLLRSRKFSFSLFFHILKYLKHLFKLSIYFSVFKFLSHWYQWNITTNVTILMLKSFWCVKMILGFSWSLFCMFNFNGLSVKLSLWFIVWVKLSIYFHTIGQLAYYLFLHAWLQLAVWTGWVWWLCWW
jgi:hypothetical protein